MSIIRNEVLKLFINRNTKFISLYTPKDFDHQLHNFSSAEHCFSGLEFLQCNDQNNLKGLARITKSIKIMKYYDINLIILDSES